MFLNLYSYVNIEFCIPGITFGCLGTMFKIFVIFVCVCYMNCSHILCIYLFFMKIILIIFFCADL